MLEGLASPGRREALKEGSGTEQQSLMPRAGSEGSTQTSPGEKKSRRRTRLPPTVTLSSRVLLVLCVLCALLLLLVVALAALTGHCLSRDTPGPSRIESCPMDWLYSRNKCYYFSVMYRKEGDWDESQRFCSSHNGSLALFDTQEDLNFLMDFSGEHHVWVGLRKREDGIHWVNGTACSSSLCSITDFGECMFIGFRALWLSACHLPRPYICSKEPYV
ncbi:C-type lectin domain family 2 member L-like isoform X1 [Pleurodeles waltl]|uniref:C-type lectin domain family 2 member L-like isoform X1 n=1 Tax=Pleurodeles waltl TaxID=8319 RepID=UPI0037096EAB